MAARRALLLILVVIIVSTVGAAVLAPRPEPVPEPSTTTTATDQAPEPASSGRLIERTVQGASRRPQELRMRVGDQLELTVRADEPTDIEIPRLGTIEHATPDAPAHFSILPADAARLVVRFADGRTVAVIRVAEPGGAGDEPDGEKDAGRGANR
jgi:hypothetical protein